MKIKFGIIFLLLILPLMSAIEIDMNDNFNRGEILTATFSGNFLESVSEDNFFFYKGHNKIPINFELMNFGNDFYIYALNDKSSGNYSLSLENLKYYKQGEITDEVISKNFTIAEEFADFTMDKGFITTKEDFEIELKNLQDKEITIEINQGQIENNSETKGFFDSLFGNFFLSLTGKTTFELEEENSITLSPNEIKKITFKIGEIPEPTIKKISLSTKNSIYEFLVYIPSKVNSNDKFSLNFEPSELKISLYPNITKEEIVTLKNIGDELLKNITIKISNDLEPYVNVSKTEIYNLDVNQSQEIHLLFTPVNKEQIIVGELIARIPNETLLITFEMFTDDSSNPSEIISSSSKNCNELNGTIFEEPQICEGEERFAKDGNCCIGEIKIPEKSDTGLIIGWAIIMVVILFLVWFFKFKYKKSKGEIDLFKIARGE
jgi:hypothetical protein